LTSDFVLPPGYTVAVTESQCTIIPRPALSRIRAAT
jgi:hypothetical protein